jgi:hypothetical protein
MNTINVLSVLSLIFFIVSLVFFFVSFVVGVRREVFGIKKFENYYYIGALFMGFALFLILTLDNGLSVESFILPIFLILLTVILMKTQLFMQKKTKEILGDNSFSSLISRINNFINLIKKGR